MSDTFSRARFITLDPLQGCELHRFSSGGCVYKRSAVNSVFPLPHDFLNPSFFSPAFCKNMDHAVIDFL